MASGAPQQSLDAAFEAIEETILPCISMMLDNLLDAAALARPGFDGDVYAAELRTVALQLEHLTREVESISPVRVALPDYRIAASA